jgi:hypothetical protein
LLGAAATLFGDGAKLPTRQHLLERPKGGSGFTEGQQRFKPATSPSGESFAAPANQRLNFRMRIAPG